MKPSPWYLMGLIQALLVMLWSTQISAADQALPDLLRQRLLLMKEVAVYKWRHQIAVEDGAREAEVVTKATEAALNRGLTQNRSRALFEAQITAAKEIQHYWLKRWAEGARPPEHIPDLVKEVRPRLLALDQAIVDAAAKTGYLESSDLDEALAVEGLSATTRDPLIAAVRNLEAYPSRLAQILDTGMLRIGTTGDYAPFSYRGSDGELSGSDIDRGNELAAALGVKPAFIDTSWPELMSDLQAGHYDIAMSGISLTLERQRYGYFSIPYHSGGKTLLGRCRDKDRYSTLDTVDQPGVRVIINPGGTNEHFVDSRIHNADKVLHPDNLGIFDAIEAGEADVMITDRIEAEWQAARRQSLCVMTAENYTYQEKAYLMPRDIDLKLFVDTWLQQAIAEGKFKSVVEPGNGAQSVNGQ